MKKLLSIAVSLLMLCASDVASAQNTEEKCDAQAWELIRTIVRLANDESISRLTIAEEQLITKCRNMVKSVDADHLRAIYKIRPIPADEFLQRYIKFTEDKVTMEALEFKRVSVLRSAHSHVTGSLAGVEMLVISSLFEVTTSFVDPSVEGYFTYVYCFDNDISISVFFKKGHNDTVVATANLMLGTSNAQIKTYGSFVQNWGIAVLQE